MELRFESLLCTLIWLTKILVRAVSNVHAGRRFPTPAVEHWIKFSIYGQFPFESNSNSRYLCSVPRDYATMDELS